MLLDQSRKYSLFSYKLKIFVFILEVFIQVEVINLRRHFRSYSFYCCNNDAIFICKLIENFEN